MTWMIFIRTFKNTTHRPGVISKFTSSTLDKAFEKQIKTVEDLGIKQIEALKALKAEENQVSRIN